MRIPGAIVFLLAMSAGAAPVSISGSGWTVTADPERQVLRIDHDKLGSVIADIRLNAGSQPVADWTAEATAAGVLTIRTAHPRGAWQFEPAADSLRISSTFWEAALTGDAPAPESRVVARLLDREGAPVTWVGTNEVAGGYGGSETKNASFLPRRNPEVMYFALGAVSGDNLHSLFDRSTDTAIDFPEGTLMQRGEPNQAVLKVSMPVRGNALVRLTPDYYTKVLGLPFYVPFDDSSFKTAPMVWSSWTSYYAEVREEDMVRNTDWIAEHLKPYGFEYMELDDGYDRDAKGQHYWIENWDREKFPHGPEWLTGYIRSKGLKAGLWLVPNAYAGAVKAHPDWYVRDKKGELINDYSTPTLDSTNPEVLGFLKHLFSTLDDWGFDYYKFDGEHAFPKYVPAVDKSRLHDTSVDPVIAYRNRLALIRETLGPKRFIEGCPAGTPLNGIGYFQSYFNGHDLYNNWQGMYPLFSSINGNAFLNHVAVYLMPGEGLELGPPMTVEEAMKKRPPSVVQTARTREDPLTGFGTTMAEARTLVSWVALTGVAYPLASVMPELPPERVQLLQATLPTMPILPIDLFSRGTDAQWDKFKHTRPDDYIHNYPEILDLKVNESAGVYDVAALTNWRSEAATRNLDLVDQLGLRADREYVVFDFWNRKLLGVVKNRLTVEVDPHDTRVLLIHPLQNRPQLTGISRHITGASSVLAVSWDAATNTLRGSSASVPGDTYSLWIHIPNGARVTAVQPAEAQYHLDGSSLMVSFPGRQTPIEWSVAFTGGPIAKSDR